MSEYEEKLEWCSYWLPDGDKIFLKICLLVSTEYTSVTENRRTDRKMNTARRHRPRLCTASRGKNRFIRFQNVVFTNGQTDQFFCDGRNNGQVMKIMPLPVRTGESMKSLER